MAATRSRFPLSGRWAFALLVLAALGIAAAGVFAWDRHRTRREWHAAAEALLRHDLAAALPHLEEYVRLRPQDPDGWFLAARTARRQGRFLDAERFLGECEKTGGSATAIRLERDLATVQRGELGEIDHHLRATIDPDHPDVGFVLESLARGYLAADRLAEAREACELWKKVDAAHPWPWLWQGWISEHLTQWDQATECYRRALALAPDSRDTRVALGRALVRRRQAAEAAEHLEWVLARIPEDSGAQLALAECRIEQGRSREAVLLSDRVLEREPGSPAALFMRGKAASVLGDDAAAEAYLHRALAAKPGNSEALYLFILSLRAQQKGAEAEQLAPRLESLHKDLQRLTELLSAIGPRHDDAAAFHEAGVIALRVGRTKEGVNLLRDALRRKGNHQATHAALAEYYRENGPSHLAEQHQRLARLP